MRVLVQRVTTASVSINNKQYSSIGKGLLVLLGITHCDTIDDSNWLSQKIAQLRIFNDSEGYLNLSVMDIAAEVMVVSQFTLYAATKKGNRPSFIQAASAQLAQPLYQHFIAQLQLLLGKPIATGSFGADMKVSLINDGPVTIWLDSHNKE